MSYYSNPDNFKLSISPNFYSGKNFDSTTLITLIEAPYVEFATLTTILSVEIPLNTCVTFFDGPTYTGKSMTFTKNTLDISLVKDGFTQVKRNIIQYSLVPYVNLGTKSYPKKAITVYGEKKNSGTKNAYLPGVHEKLSINISSIDMVEGTKVELTDDKNNTVTFYHHVHFIDVFGPITSSSIITKITVTLLNTDSTIIVPCTVSDDIENFMSSPALLTFMALMIASFIILFFIST